MEKICRAAGRPCRDCSRQFRLRLAPSRAHSGFPIPLSASVVNRSSTAISGARPPAITDRGAAARLTLLIQLYMYTKPQRRARLQLRYRDAAEFAMHDSRMEQAGRLFFPIEPVHVCVCTTRVRVCASVCVCVCGPERASAQVDVCMRGTTNFLMTATSQGRASSYSALHALQSALPSSSRWNLDYTRAREEAVRLSSSPWIFGITGLDEVCLGSEEVGS